MKCLVRLFIFLSAITLYPNQYDIRIPTRQTDPAKKFLAADLYSTNTTVPKPTILIQTPYNRKVQRVIFRLPQSLTEQQMPFDTVNYNYVVLDWRGFFDSKSADIPGYDRGLDGYDAVEWIASQKWSNGRIGTYGASALGLIQYQTARRKPPHLVCINPIVKDYKTKYTDYYYGGVYRKEHVEHIISLGFFSSPDLILAHPDYDITWKTVETQSDYPNEIEVPALIIGGWYDHFPSDVIRSFIDLKTKNPAAGEHKIIIGPWTHGDFGKLQQGILTYPEAQNIPLEASQKFFDYYLLKKNNGWDSEYQTKFFVLGFNKWLNSNSLSSMLGNKFDTLYLHPDKTIRLEPIPVTFAAIPPDTIFYDPKNPSPTVGGERFPIDRNIPIGPQNISEDVEGRSDVLVYRTEPALSPIYLLGKLKVRLYISSDSEDTDFGVRLCDYDSEGRSIIIRQGIKRMRFRESYEKEVLMQPSVVYPVEVEIDDLAYFFQEGHRLEIVVSSSNYPMFDINLNNGKELYKPGDTLKAINLIHYSSDASPAVIYQTWTELGVDDANKSNDETVKLYPNPTTGMINIETNFQTQLKMSITNTLGVELASFESKKANLEKNIMTFDLSKYPQGIYFLKTTGNNFFDLKKIIYFK
ncbi:MAG: PepX protein [Ignavibacteria bacterium]|nr:PepX protein [Ignavibacteria bacterium]